MWWFCTERVDAVNSATVTLATLTQFQSGASLVDEQIPTLEH